jgi:hypothetical protein
MNIKNKITLLFALFNVFYYMHTLLILFYEILTLLLFIKNSNLNYRCFLRKNQFLKVFFAVNSIVCV